MMNPNLEVKVPVAEAGERVVLASLAEYGIDALEGCRNLRADMFYTSTHRTLFRAMCELLATGVTPEASAIADALRARGELDVIGGIAAVLDATDILNASKQVAHHSGAVVDAWKRRRGMALIESYSRRFAEEPSVDEVLAALQSEVFNVMQQKAKVEDPSLLAITVPILNRTLDYSKSAKGLSYGHCDLDAFTNGMQPGEVTIAGARSAVGKSALMIQAAYHNAKRGVGVSLFSLEMDERSVSERLWSLASKLPYEGIRRKLLDETQRKELERVALEMAEWPIRVYADGDISLAHIAATARMDARAHEMKLCIVDYAQIVNTEGNTIVDRVRDTSRHLTKLAKAEGIHLMLLSQLRKLSIEQYNRPPRIDDLAESRQLENDGHIVLLLHRGWNEEAGCLSENAELIVAKHRNGRPGTVRAKFNFTTASFDTVPRWG